MGFVLALPKDIELKGDDVGATFVVPAPKGCNLNCSFCVIRARHESKENCLTVSHYQQFLEYLCEQYPISIVSIQGHEPLLPKSWPYTSAIIQQAREKGIRTAIVTNGTHLAERISDLEHLNVDGITVSLDAASAQWHDMIRGTQGAFQATLQGIQALQQSTLLSKRLIVTSVLQRNKGHYLMDMPALLSSLGVDRWVINPLCSVGKTRPGGPVDSYHNIVKDLKQLQQQAQKHGIRLLVDDEMGKLSQQMDNIIDLQNFEMRMLKRINRVVRLSPDGTCSVGSDILKKVDEQQQWHPAESSASRFLQQYIAPQIEMHETAY